MHFRWRVVTVLAAINPFGEYTEALAKHQFCKRLYIQANFSLDKMAQYGTPFTVHHFIDVMT